MYNFSMISGIVRGELKYVAGRPLFSFLGIPYAEAPVGDLRFQPPKKHPGWQVSFCQSSNYFGVLISKHSFSSIFQGVYPALNFKPPCPQPTGSESVSSTMNEDCLYLNVWTPDDPSSVNLSKKKKVLMILEGKTSILLKFNIKIKIV